MISNTLMAATATLALVGGSAAWAQTGSAPDNCAAASATAPCKPTASHQPPSPTAADRTTEPVSADPMYSPSDTLAPKTASTAHPLGQPPTFHSSSMPSGDAAKPSGAQPGDPMAPEPMPGSGP